MFRTHWLAPRLFRTSLVLLAAAALTSPLCARTVKSVSITSVSQYSVSCGSTTTVTASVTVAVPTNFVGPESGTILIMEEDGLSDDIVGSGTYTVTAADVDANRQATVTTVVTLNCYAANSDCECDFGNRPNQVDDDHGTHTIYAKEKDSGVKSKPNGLTGQYVDIVSCLKTGGKLAMAYPDYVQPGGTVLISMGYEDGTALNHFDWTFETDPRYASIRRAWFSSAVDEAFDATLVNFGANSPGEVRFQALNEIPTAINLGDAFQLYIELDVSLEAPYGELIVGTKTGSEMRDVLNNVVPVNHPSSSLSIAPADDAAPEIDSSRIAFEADNQTLEGTPGAIRDDFLGEIRDWVAVTAAIVGADGDWSFTTTVDVPDDGHFILDSIETTDVDVALVVQAIDRVGNSSELWIDLDGAPTRGADYHAAVPSTGDGFGSYFAIGPCGQLAGWADVDGRGVPALNVGGEVRVFDSLSRLSHGLGTNARGWIVGQYQVTSGFAPFILDPEVGVFPVPTLGGGRGVSYAIDDSSRYAVGMSTESAESLVYEPTLWFLASEGGELFAEALRLPGLGGNGGVARDVNNLGTIAGSATDAQNNAHAVIWEEVAPGEHVLHDLGPGSASAVNDFGLVVGTLRDRRGVDNAFFSDRGEVVFLPGLASCRGCATSAIAVNDRGEILGFARQPGGGSIPLYWSLDDGVSDPVDVRSLVPSGSVEARLDWVTGINDAGQILAGGKIGATPVSVLLSPTSVDADADFVPDLCRVTPTEEFTRSDANGDGSHDITDPIFLLAFLFSGGAEPTCLDAADFNDDGSVDISDAITGLDYLFLGGASIAAPFPGCGADSTPDTLGCENVSVCTSAGADDDDDGFVKEPCEGATAGNVFLARHECRGGFYAVVNYQSYTCPDGTLQWVEIEVLPSQQRCP